MVISHIRLYGSRQESGPLVCPQGIDFNSPMSPETFAEKLALLGAPKEAGERVEAFLSFTEEWLHNFIPPRNSYEFVSRELLLEAIRGVRAGGFGISAAIIDRASREILVITPNQQIQLSNTGAHAEMQAFDTFERKFPERVKCSVNTLAGGDPYDKGLELVASTEPCPMCLTRSAIAGVPVKFLAPGGDDGMVSRVSHLPPFWQEQASEHGMTRLEILPNLTLMAHLLFYSFLIPDFDAHHTVS